MAQIFFAGDTLQVSAAGRDVPAFGPEQVTMPPSLRWKTPFPEPTTIPTSHDFAFAWDSGQPGAQAVLEISATIGNARVIASCSYDASAGAGTVPSAALTPLASASSAETALLQRATTPFDAGSWTIALRATAVHRGAVRLQ